MKEFGPDTLKIRELAERVKEAFIYCRSYYRGEPNYSPSKRWDEHFEKAAELILELKAEPREFVKAQFEAFKLSVAIQPPHLHGSGARARYEKVGTYDIRYNRSYEHLEKQLEILEVRKKAGISIKDCLLSDTAEHFDPLFRCIMGKLFGFESVYNKYLDEAKKFLEDHPVEKDVYHNLMPAERLRLEAIEWL